MDSSDGVGRLVNDAAEFADRTYDRLAQELRTARSMGQVAVLFGSNAIKRRVRPQPTAATTEPARPSKRHAQGPSVEHGAIDDLIAGYDDLSASQVVGLLEDLDPAGLLRVADHERRGRNRRTILGRLAQLLEQRP